MDAWPEPCIGFTGLMLEMAQPSQTEKEQIRVLESLCAQLLCYITVACFVYLKTGYRFFVFIVLRKRSDKIPSYLVKITTLKSSQSWSWPNEFGRDF